MKIIKLTQNKKAIVDNKDFKLLNKFKWIYLSAGRGYAVTYINNKLILMHRLILNPSFQKEIDHRNGNGLDNRRCNIRICEHKDNMRNRKLQKNNTSGFKGVSLFKKKSGWTKWRAAVQVNGKKICLGFFDNLEEAAKTYNEGAIKYFGEFAKLNFG